MRAIKPPKLVPSVSLCGKGGWYGTVWSVHRVGMNETPQRSGARVPAAILSGPRDRDLRCVLSPWAWARARAGFLSPLCPSSEVGRGSERGIFLPIFMKSRELSKERAQETGGNLTG